MNIVDRPGRPPLSPQDGWLSDGRQVLHFNPVRYSRYSQALELTTGELIPGQAPLLKSRKEITRVEAIRLWAEKRKAGWQTCPPQWTPPPPLRTGRCTPDPMRVCAALCPDRAELGGRGWRSRHPACPVACTAQGLNASRCAPLARH